MCRNELRKCHHLLNFSFAALVSVSEEVRSRCHVKHSLARMLPDSNSADGFSVDIRHTSAPVTSQVIINYNSC